MKNNTFNPSLEQNEAMQIEALHEPANQDVQMKDNKKRKDLDEEGGRKKGKKALVKKNESLSIDTQLLKKLRRQSFPILDAHYKTKLLNSVQVKQKLEELRGQTRNPVEFLLLFKFDFFRDINPETDTVFQWFLDELETCIEEIPKYQPRRKGSTNEATVLIKSICANEALLAEVLKRGKIKEVIYRHYIFQIINNLFDVEKITANPLEFLNQYFPDIKEHLKMEPILVEENGEGKKFLDLFLHPQYRKYLLQLWKEGFRPFSQQRFNELLFSYDFNREYGEFSHDIIQFYVTVARDDTFQDFFAFSEDIDPLLLFIENPLIDANLFKELQKKVTRNCNYESLVQKTVSQSKYNIYYFHHKDKHIEKYLNLINKLIFCLSQCHSIDHLESTPGFLNTAKSELHMFLSMGVGLVVASTINTQAIIPESTLANETLFFGFKLLFKDPTAIELNESIKNLIHILKERNANKSQLLNLFFYLYVSNNNQVRKNSLFHELLRELIKGISPHEILQIVNKYFSFMSLFQAKLNVLPTQQGLSWRQAIPDFILFITKAISLNSAQQDAIHMQLPVVLCNLLILQVKLQCQLNDQKSDIFTPEVEKVITSFLTQIAEIREEKLNAKILMPFALNMIFAYKNAGIQLLEVISQIEPSWINYIPTLPLPLHNRKLDLLSFLLTQLSSKDDSIVIKNADIILYLLAKLMNNKIPLSPDFLQNLAELQLNFQKKSLLSQKAQEALELIFNQCIHKVRGTEQEALFEDMRTKILLKADLDPSKDPQAIHTRENHLYADQIYQEWLQTLGTKEEQKEKLLKGLGLFISYISLEKEKTIKNSLAFTQDPDKLKELIGYIYGLRNEETDSEQIKEIHERVIYYNKALLYLQQIKTRAMTPSHHGMKTEEHRIIEDAQKLLNIISMVGYYSDSSLTQPFIRDGNEALNILKLELFDQIEHPSCDQGPYMRFLMALEPVTNIKFPTLQRRTIPFIIKNYINDYYQQLPREAKQQFIQEIYGKIDDLEGLEEIETLPANAFDSLVKVFLADNEGRLGYLTPKEVRDLFNYERPKEYHPEIIKDLNQYHQLKKEKTTSSATNLNRFFALSPATSADDDTQPSQGLNNM